MDTSDITEFLNKREFRVTSIETANTLYQTEFDSLLTSSHPVLDVYHQGCVYQYFAFSRKILIDFMFMNFFTVLGSFKNESLQEWEKIPFSDAKDKNSIMNDLKTIRKRYAEARNKIICHINDDMEKSSYSIPTKQIADDIKDLRNIFNKIRIDNNIPIVVSINELSNRSSVAGLSKVISILKGASMNS